MPICGNGIAETGEECDTDDLRNEDCNSVGREINPNGSLYCFNKFPELIAPGTGCQFIYESCEGCNSEGGPCGPGGGAAGFCCTYSERLTCQDRICEKF